MGYPNVLSVQFLDSNFNSGQGSGYACNGGTSYEYAQWYASIGYFIPWSNANAAFADTGINNGKNGNTAIVASLISTNPKLSFQTITDNWIDTYPGLESISPPDSSTVILDLKTILNSLQPISFTF